MAKPLLLYMPIYDYVAESLVNQMNDIPIDEDIELWVNSPGGRVFAGWSIIGPMQKRKGKIKTSIFGNASSMAAYMPIYSDYAEALDVTQFILHRADGYVETPEDQDFLDRINKDLRKQMEKRFDLDAFQRITGKTMDDMFNPGSRIDISLTAKQAKEIKLIDKIIKLEPKQIESMSKQFVAFADFSDPTQEAETQRSETTKPIENSNNQKPKVKMTLAELQAQHPELYAQIVNGAINAERDRVGSYMAFIEYDKENVIKAINEGVAFSSKVMTEMTVKMTAHMQKANLEADGNIEKPATEKPREESPKSPEQVAIDKEIESIEGNSKKFVESYKW